MVGLSYPPSPFSSEPTAASLAARKHRRQTYYAFPFLPIFLPFLRIDIGEQIQPTSNPSLPRNSHHGSMNQQKNDIELGVLRNGYPALADWIARDPDNETFVFRRFDKLAARNILHLQAQLIALEREIEQLDEKAQQSSESEVRQSLRRYETLIKRAKDASNTGNIESELISKLKELKELLKDYHEAICLQSQISGMNRPRDRPLSAFREFLDGTAFKDEDENLMPLISGRAKAFLNNPNDLLALTKQEDDYLSRFLQDHWFFRKRKKTDDPLDRTTIYKNAHIVRTVAAVDMLLAAVLLIGAIAHLYFVTQPKTKLGLVAMYTLLFASSMVLCTNARRAEIFAATATYAAVLVVFVSGDLGADAEQCLIQLDGGLFKTIRCPD